MLKVGFKSDKGNRRRENEDSLFVMPTHNVFVVCDGVGGHNGGALASRTAVTLIAKYIRANPIKEQWDTEFLKEYFIDGLQIASDEITKLSEQDERYVGMATTAVLIYINGHKAFVSNIGDSRAYIIRDKNIAQITEDHTVVRELIKEGTITTEEAEIHPMQNMITKALGGDPVIDPDFYEVDARKGDIFLLCTDGLYGELSKEEICNIVVSKQHMNDVCNSLVREANNHGGSDNITAICVKI